MMDENPYKAPQIDDHPPKPKVTPNDRWPYLNAIVACLVSATILGVLANLVIAPEFKTTSLTQRRWFGRLGHVASDRTFCVPTGGKASEPVRSRWNAVTEHSETISAHFSDR